MWKLILATCAALMAASIVTADEFDEQLAKYTAKTASVKAKKLDGVCVCGGDPNKCTCGNNCICFSTGDCRNPQNHRPEVKALPAAPAATFKHDCGCPSMSCNCGAGGCHCSENRIDNRQPSRWVKDGMWYWMRGSTILGQINSEGVYFPYDAPTKTWGQPCKQPAPLPSKEQTMVMQAAPVCRS